MPKFSFVAACALLAWGRLASGSDVLLGPPTDPTTTEAVTRFTLDLYKSLGSGSGDVCASPLNVAVALQMTAAGARGRTADEIARTLHLSVGDASHDAFGRLLDTIRAAAASEKSDALGLWTADAGWFDESEKILPGYVEVLKRAYDAKPHRVDFQRSADAARETINRWVADQTRDKIRDLLKPENVRPGTAFVLTSALYFKGDWAFPFDTGRTIDAEFRSPGGSVPIRLMNQDASNLPYFEDDSVQVASLPYRGNSLAMMVVLPREVDGLAAVEASLAPEKIHQWATSLRPSSVKLAIPRFKSTGGYQLNDVLTRLGMPSAFQAGRADFSGITGQPGLFISDVVHKAFVEVDEKGTEAAAATAVVGVRGAPSKPVEFRADRPFLYLIRDTASGAILFIGRLSRPAA